MTKYHVEFDIEADHSDEVLSDLYGAFHDTKNVIVSATVPKFVPGWYQFIGDDEDGSVSYTDESDDLEWMQQNADEWRRVMPPEPYKEGPQWPIGGHITEEQFDSLPNGSVIMDRDGDRWTRRDDDWTHPHYKFPLHFKDYEPYALVSVE